MNDLSPSQTLLPLLALLVNRGLAAGAGSRRFRLEALHLEAGKAVFDVGVRGVAWGVDGLYPLELLPKECRADRTICELRMGGGSGLSRLAGLGSRLVPRPLLNEALKHLLGEGVRVEGKEVHLLHRELLHRIREALAQPKRKE